MSVHQFERYGEKKYHENLDSVMQRRIEYEDETAHDKMNNDMPIQC